MNRLFIYNVDMNFLNLIHTTLTFTIISSYFIIKKDRLFDQRININTSRMPDKQWIQLFIWWGRWNNRNFKDFENGLSIVFCDGDLVYKSIDRKVYCKVHLEIMRSLSDLDEAEQIWYFKEKIITKMN